MSKKNDCPLPHRTMSDRTKAKLKERPEITQRPRKTREKPHFKPGSSRANPVTSPVLSASRFGCSHNQHFLGSHSLWECCMDFQPLIPSGPLPQAWPAGNSSLLSALVGPQSIFLYSGQRAPSPGVPSLRSQAWQLRSERSVSLCPTHHILDHKLTGRQVVRAA